MFSITKYTDNQYNMSYLLSSRTNRDHLDYADAAEAAVKFLPASTPNLCKAAK